MANYLTPWGEIISADVVTENHKVLGLGGNPVDVVAGDILIPYGNSETYDIISGHTPEDLGWSEVTDTPKHSVDDTTNTIDSGMAKTDE